MGSKKKFTDPPLTKAQAKEIARIEKVAQERLARERAERDAQYGYLGPRARAVVEALIAAQEHLEYCGYGDRWERECALDGPDPLDKKIEAALAGVRRPK